MEWLVALLVLLGLAALAGLVWLHFGRDPVGLTARSPRQSESGQRGGEPAELSITVGYLRRRASHYRDMAVKVDDAIAEFRTSLRLRPANNDASGYLERTLKALSR